MAARARATLAARAARAAAARARRVRNGGQGGCWKGRPALACACMPQARPTLSPNLGLFRTPKPWSCTTGGGEYGVAGGSESLDGVMGGLTLAQDIEAVIDGCKRDTEVRAWVCGCVWCVRCVLACVWGRAGACGACGTWPRVPGCVWARGGGGGVVDRCRLLARWAHAAPRGRAPVLTSVLSLPNWRHFSLKFRH